MMHFKNLFLGELGSAEQHFSQRFEIVTTACGRGKEEMCKPGFWTGRGRGRRGPQWKTEKRDRTEPRERRGNEKKGGVARGGRGDHISLHYTPMQQKKAAWWGWRGRDPPPGFCVAG